jgi:surfactin family lipopeptide synthetase C
MPGTGDVLSEMSRTAVRHPDVAEAEAFAAERGDGHLLTVAVVPVEFANPLEIREFLRTHLPLPEEVATPAVALVSRIPRDTAGRLLSDELAELVARLPEGQFSVFAPAVTHMEEVLCALMAEVTGRERVGVLDDFLDLGGTSVSTVALSSLIHQRYGVSLPLEEVFEASHARGMALLVEQELAGLPGAVPEGSA